MPIPRALLMCLANPAASPRPRRMLRLLRERGFAVDLLSYPTEESALGGSERFTLPHGPAGLPARLRHRAAALVHFGLRLVVHDDARRDRLSLQRLGLAGYVETLGGRPYDLIVVEDLYLLPLAMRIRGAAKVIFDAREFYPRQNDENLWFRLSERPERERLCRTLLPRCDAVLTVSPGLVDAYAAEFGVRAELVMSAPWYRKLSPTPMQADRIRLVHAGIANPNRQLEKMVDIVAALDARFSLDFYLTGSPDYITLLQARAAETGGRVRILPPVTFDDIVPTLNRYDVGLYYLEPIAFNLRHSLPNKLFEFIQARLMVAIGPSPDMARVVEAHGCGVVAPRFEIPTMVETLRRLTSAEVERAKHRAHAAAAELCFEREAEKLHRLLVRLVPGAHGAAV
jgi:hypothetical protein